MNRADLILVAWHANHTWQPERISRQAVGEARYNARGVSTPDLMPSWDEARKAKEVTGLIAEAMGARV